jgi:methionine-rich copper-binding protein CopC
MKVLAAIVALGLSMTVPAVGFAHTALSSSVPKSGSELTVSPATIEIQFREPARLTSVVLVAADMSERKLEFTASEKPNTFTVKDPKLASGRNEILWKALSKDGHVATGSLIFTLKPKAN